MWPASWSSGQSFWILITRSRVQFPALPWGFFLVRGRIPVVTMVWVVSRFRLKVETSIKRSHTSINSDWIHDKDLLALGDLTTLTAANISAHRVTNTLIADYGREKKNCINFIRIRLYFIIINYEKSGEKFTIILIKRKQNLWPFSRSTCSECARDGQSNGNSCEKYTFIG